ncbi:DNA helicase rad5 [Friedmanniomyces endolithicus]|uniref:DNA helicase rad5 n=1 Tax=Friedmanniomyces endolithicus TaxID=329885 RepID=A0AAN6K765_9PEZI|nr:DNA helicase rad5 [Friedmanniomyces endolithicus]KAK0967527.1 DNA helicase rad5 [Friedmanniomyces endolithicus]KAK1006047.1 DNA helicase rad5 [Friedmanniomyces endolithicus]KAK1048994.1 DNA helicase rad5 [Friedmanniomyces endolithicus]
MAEMQEPVYKKRRFFVDHSPVRDSNSNNTFADTNDTTAEPVTETESSSSDDVFDAAEFASIVGGEVPGTALRSLQARFGRNIEQAINAYFDGSWKTPSPQKPPLAARYAGQKGIPFLRKDPSTGSSSSSKPTSAPSPLPALDSMPRKRYLGAFGVAGWATRSGSDLLKPGAVVKIERTRQQLLQKLGRGGKVKQSFRKTQDVIVRFTNTNGEEIGRLEKDNANWISTLVDAGICWFEGHCIFAEERIKTNDTVYLQLRCYLLKQAFDATNFIKPVEDRETGIFEAKETTDERDLRLRQIALVKLFSEMNLHPSKVNETTARHRREGILQAAEVSERYEQKDKTGTPPESAAGSSPPNEDTVEDGKELEQDQLDRLYQKAQIWDFNTPEAQLASSFAMSLRKYQRQGLQWMLQKETSQTDDGRQQSMHPLWEEYDWPLTDADDKDLPAVTGHNSFYVSPYSGELSLIFPVQEQTCLGGILADEMGLGKTIEMLALVHSNPSPQQQAGMESGALDTVNNLPRLSKTSASVERAPATTLVVAPMSLLAQWASEAEKASKTGTLKVLVYYGNEKNVNLQTLCCGANTNTAPNLIITSYGVVLSEFNGVAAMGGNRGSHGGLFSVEYWRVILDEAHMIKNRQSKSAKACYELAATHRWVLTGTPIVNRLEDLFSLIRFLRVEPWSNFSFWKTFITNPFEKGEFVRSLDVVQTVLEPLVLRRTKDMKTPDGEALVPLPPKTVLVERLELSGPEREVYQHLFANARRSFAANVDAGTLMKSYTTIFAHILRLRQSCCHPLLTRNKTILAEEEAAEEAADIAKGLGDDMDLSALLERFSADEGEQDASKFGSHVLRQIQEEEGTECPICSEEPMVEQAVTGCWHSACKKCLMDYIEHQIAKGELPRCFNCREPINARDVFEVIREDEEMDDVQAGSALTAAIDLDDGEDGDSGDELYTSTQRPADSNKAAKLNIAPTTTTTRISLRRVNQLSSIKISVLLTALKSLRKTDSLTKSVVFSQFTSFLDLIGPALMAARIPTLRFDGSMSQRERARVLTDFANRTGFTVLLLSLRAGGVGLNLTCAKRVFMLDPWWSFAVEAQAIDRVHRMGQTEAVEVVRFIIEGSIEEKMLKIQERKKFIASSLGMMSEEDKKAQRIEDIRELLS